jgi:hypothetical protein
MFTITAYLGVKLIMVIKDVIITTYLDVKLSRSFNQNDLTLYITLIRSMPHIRFPKFAYEDEKFLGKLEDISGRWDQVLSINLY